MIAQVIVDVLNSEVDKIFDYLVPENSAISLGDRVLLPFGARKIEGYVIGFKENSDLPQDKLRSIFKKCDDFPVIKPELLQLSHELKNKYHLRMLDGIRLVVPSQIRSGKVGHIEVKMLSLANDEVVDSYLKKIRANAKNEIGVITYLKDIGKSDFTKLAKKFSAQTLNKLIKIGVIISNTVVVNRTLFNDNSQDNKVKLTTTQQNAVNKISNSKGKFLLHGVTGSGKTEVYLQVIEKVLCAGKSAIMLVPEISLTPQMIRVFTARFGNCLAVLHSGLSMGERFDEWHRLYSGEAKIVVGARSAIFAPLENLGVIIIDEEHDSSYVSDSNPRYNTYDVAKWRSEYNKCPLVVGSATPNIDTYYSSQIGELELIEMPTRVNNKEMPKIEIVDMLSEFRGGNNTPFSKRLIELITHTIEEKHQCILFINRRGFSSFVMCRDCGYIPRCEDCDFSLVYHKQDNQLKCHYCGKRYKSLTNCPTCGSDNLKYGGVGTQQVVEQLQNLFPNIPIFRMDNDTTTSKNAHAKILGEFSKQKPSILVGTQMVAKGHDFPQVDLVGILDADLSLYFNDYRASEKTFQLITQVAGRAGRSEIEGKVVLQTYYPKHYVYKLCANYDYNRFYAKEINLRQTTNFPPFTKVVRILFTSEDDEKSKLNAHDVFMKLKELRISRKNQFYFLEGMKSPVTKIKNKYRYQIVSRFNASVSDEIIDEIYKIVDDNQRKNVSVFIEINPLTLS